MLNEDGIWSRVQCDAKHFSRGTQMAASLGLKVLERDGLAAHTVRDSFSSRVTYAQTPFDCSPAEKYTSGKLGARGRRYPLQKPPTI